MAVAKVLIGTLLNKMSESLDCGFIYSKIIPGNHDMSLPDTSRTAADIEKWNKEEHLQDELDRMTHFLIIPRRNIASLKIHYAM